MIIYQHLLLTPALVTGPTIPSAPLIFRAPTPIVSPIIFGLQEGAVKLTELALVICFLPDCVSAAWFYKKTSKIIKTAWYISLIPAIGMHISFDYPIISLAVDAGIEGTVISFSCPIHGTVESLIIIKSGEFFMGSRTLRSTMANKGDNKDRGQELHAACQLSDCLIRAVFFFDLRSKVYFAAVRRLHCGKRLMMQMFSKLQVDVFACFIIPLPQIKRHSKNLKPLVHIQLFSLAHFQWPTL